MYLYYTLSSWRASRIYFFYHFLIYFIFIAANWHEVVKFSFASSIRSRDMLIAYAVSSSDSTAAGLAYLRISTSLACIKMKVKSNRKFQKVRERRRERERQTYNATNFKTQREVAARHRDSDAPQKSDAVRRIDAARCSDAARRWHIATHTILISLESSRQVEFDRLYGSTQ